MSKKNKKNNKLNVFTEEELKDLELNDDGILEVSFGENDSENKKNVPHKGKQKVGATAKKTSELDKRVAAILKKIDVEDDPVEDDDDEEAMGADTFKSELDKLKEAMENKIDELPSTKEAAALKERYLPKDNFESLQKLANKYTGFMYVEFAEDDVKDLKEQIKESDDPLEKARLRKELKKAKVKLVEARQSREAKIQLARYNLLKQEVKHKKQSRIEDDVRELYRKYGNEGIRKLLTLGIDEDDEEAI